MNVILDAIRYELRGNFFALKAMDKLKKDGLETLANYGEHFKGASENDFNLWVVGPGKVYNQSKTQTVLAQTVFVDYLISKKLKKQGEAR